MIKFRKKNKKLFLVTQVLGIWYCVLLTVIYLSSSTGAAFNDVEVIENRLHVSWPINNTTVNGDKSSLKFQNSAGFQCAKGFYSSIKNVGNKDMQGTSTFVLYYNGNEDPNKNKLGIEIGRGTVPALKSGESFNLTFLPELKPSSGNYKFMAFQRTGHEGSGQLWGDSISVNDNQINTCDQWKSDTEEEKIDEESTSTSKVDTINNNEQDIVTNAVSEEDDVNESKIIPTEEVNVKNGNNPYDDVTESNDNEKNEDLDGE